MAGSDRSGHRCSLSASLEARGLNTNTPVSTVSRHHSQLLAPAVGAGVLLHDAIVDLALRRG